ncbi:terminase large subunit domain-containing protein [Petrimonas sulfuriphila]|uniref:terminase large subunit domain-containing protein n=1 Tax=Petrimonas sulfuriphila TaxID=285070 RepID=UPI003EBFC1F6
MEIYTGKYYKGQDVLSCEYVQSLRDKDRKAKNPYKIIAQRGGQENMLACDADIIFGGGSRGGSKAQIYRDLVCTPFGFKQMGDLKIGDTISNVNGGKQQVIHITELGHTKVYRLHFSDGTHVNCTEDHLWAIKDVKSTKNDINWGLWTMKDIMNRLDSLPAYKSKSGKIYSNLLIPLCEPVNFTNSLEDKKTLIIKPYTLGAFLGDGVLTNKIISRNRVTLCNSDEEVTDRVRADGYIRTFPHIDKRDGSISTTYYDEALVNGFKELGLAGCSALTKFIPDQYKYGSIEDRFALAQGLMDTDGTYGTGTGCSFVTISKQLAEDLAFVLRSLGAYVTVTRHKSTYTSKKTKEVVQANDRFILYIRIKDSKRLFHLKRKKERCVDGKNELTGTTKMITGYEFIGYDKCRCIAVSDPTALYITNDFNVTHNSFSLLLETLKDYKNKDFRATIFRREVDDLSDLIDTSHSVYGDFGTYNRSKADMTWNFQSGASLKFNYYSDNYEEFKVRMQGKQYSYIGIDEVTHIEYPKFKYLITNNRNAYGIRNRIWGTSNPDPDSWVAKFIDWWIGDDGLPIKERNGVVRYCFMNGDSINDIVWGDSREEVYEQCRSIIDKYWLPAYEEYGTPADLFVKSVAFVEAKLADNIQLMRSDPTYLANLAGQSEEQRSRDLEGNWKFKTVGDDMIKMPHMEAFFGNAQQTGDKTRRASLDAAFDGGDNLVMWLWEGWHIKDLFVCRKDSKDTVDVVRAKLKEWHVLEENFTYDLNGIGQIFKGFFKSAVPFNNRESVADEDKGLYDTLKSQAAYLFAKKIINKEVSIEPYLLDYRFDSGKNKNVHLRQILMDERKAIKANTLAYDKGFSLIKKVDMKKLVGHSPDFIEAMLMIMIFEIKKKKSGGRPRWGGRYINPQYQYR